MKKGWLSLTAIAAIIVSAAVLIGGCEKKFTISDTPTQQQPDPVVTDNVKVAASVSGMVVDENDVPVMGAAVSGGGSTTTTNKYGIFRFDNISLAETNGYVKVSKPGYFTGSRSFITTAGRTHNVRIKLLTKNNTGNFTASAGGAISLTSGAKVVMPTNAVTDAAGNAYSGTVNVAMTWIDPSSNELATRMPGDLRGITTAGSERGLESFGMVGVELTGNNGQELKIATGKTAELTFPIPSSLLASAPATIDLWHFDETAGRWKQEGKATKTGNNYIGQVAHFSFWNADIPVEVVRLSLTLIDQASNEPMNGVTVRIKRPNGSPSYGVTDAMGNITGLVPAREALVLEVLAQCQTVVATKNIGPFTANTSLGNITATIPSMNLFKVTGMVKDCSNANLADGSVNVYLSDGHFYIVPVKNGVFMLQVVTCPNYSTVSYSIVPIDNKAQQEGTAAVGTNITGSLLNVGTLQACGASTQEKIELMIDGTPISFLSPTDSISNYDSASLNAPTHPVISAFNGIAPNRNDFALSFISSTGTTGSFPIRQLYIQRGTAMGYQIVSANPTVTITELGAKQTGYIAGNFNVVMDFGGTQRNVTGSFRIKRAP